MQLLIDDPVSSTPYPYTLLEIQKTQKNHKTHPLPCHAVQLPTMHPNKHTYTQYNTPKE